MPLLPPGCSRDQLQALMTGVDIDVWHRPNALPAHAAWSVIADCLADSAQALLHDAGAWPKLRVQEGTEAWLVKLPRPAGQLPYQALWLEHLASEQARAMGLAAVHTAIWTVAADRQGVLAVTRFDEPGSMGQGMASTAPLILSLHSVASVRERNSPSWEGGVRVLTELTQSSPDQALRDDLVNTWLERMLFFIGLNITDDHWRNHELWFQQGQWQWTPAYDLMPEPDDNGHLCSLFGQKKLRLSPDHIESQRAFARLDEQLGRSPGQTAKQAARLREQLMQTWPERLARDAPDVATRQKGLAALQVGCGP